MKLILFGVLLVGRLGITHQQQQECRVVWNEGNQGPDVQISGIKGEPGVTGGVGEIGPRGPRGHRGEKGDQGPVAGKDDLMRLITDLTNKVDLLQTKFNESSSRLENLIQFGHSESCASSLFRGPQLVRSGERVYCDDGWQVFQRRYDGSVSFDRNWVDYKNGFGDLSTEFWMGLEKLHQITRPSARCRLRVDLEDFSGDQGFAEYNTFSIGDEESSYLITISGFSGNITNDLTPADHQSINGMKFSTRDSDNDIRATDHCALDHGGAWWHGHCSHVRLNGLWSRTSSSPWVTMSWYYWKRRWGGIKASKMKIKCE